MLVKRAIRNRQQTDWYRRFEFLVDNQRKSGWRPCREYHMVTGVESVFIIADGDDPNEPPIVKHFGDERQRDCITIIDLP